MSYKLKWTVGIITAPRDKGYYLDKTSLSLQKAGWDDLNIFAEPDSIIPNNFLGHIIHRRKQYGDWTNWATALYELLLSEPDTDYFFMAEDDFVVCKTTKVYLEKNLPNLGKFGSLSLYTPSRYWKQRSRPCFHNEGRGRDTWSTVTVIMQKQQVIRFFSDPDVQQHRFCDLSQVGKFGPGFKASYGAGRTSIIDNVGNTVKDAVIGQWAKKNNLPVYFHTPSLAEHIGFHSTLTDDLSSPDNGRMSKDFVGEDFDTGVWDQPQIIRFTDLPQL